MAARDPGSVPSSACVEAQITPPWPYRLPRGGGEDAVMRARAGVVSRLLHVGERPVLVRAAQRRDGVVLLRAEGSERTDCELAIERMRFALALDDDYHALYAEFKRDRLLGAAIRRLRWHRPRRRPWPWEALAWSITKQLIESGRAAAIQRRMVFRWGVTREDTDGLTLRDVPTPELIAGRAPAELAARDLSAARALAMIRVAREVTDGRVDPADPADDHRLLRIREIGPWTIQCLGLYGRGEPDSLPAGDLGYIKLVGRLAGLGRRATIEEVEEFYRPYEPFRGLAGDFMLTAHHKAIAQGPPLRMAA
jgi:3-methyladenine DNA glycosylase/8-oxoguanine DNA glycosylase